jgi:hypothetical protein
MKKKFSIINFFLKISILLILILVTFFASPLFLNLNNYKSNFEMELSSLLKTSVKIEGNIEYTFKTGPKLLFKNIFLESGEANTINGQFEKLNIITNPFGIFKKNFSFESFSIDNGNISISKNFIQTFTKNNKIMFKKINFKNVDLKIINSQSEIEFNNNIGKIFFNKENISGVVIEGLVSDLPFQFRLKNSNLEFKVPSIKFFLKYSFVNLKNENNFLQVRFANKIFFPGFKNIYFRSNIFSNDRSIKLNDIKITSSVYSGLGSAKIERNQNSPFFNLDLIFGRTNFSSISEASWVSFFNKSLFEMAKLVNGNIKVKFSNIIMENDYFDSLNIDATFNSGDVILNNVDFISDEHSFNLSGRFVQNENDFLLFFNSKFSTNQLKKLCNKYCQPKVLKDNYSMEAKGILNIKKSKFYLDDFFSSKKLTKAELDKLNQDLNNIFSGNLEKVFVLKNFLSLY